MPTPTRAMSFAQLQIQTSLRQALGAMSISEPTPIQAEAIPVLLEGRDVIGQARTGSGKTLAFALPLVERCDPRVRGVQALVLVPTRELAIQVGSVVDKLATAVGLRHTLLYGGRSLVPERRALTTAQIVVGTPGRTLDHLRQGSLSLGSLRIFVLDEGDEMLDRGFAPDVERILSHTPKQRQTALFSATLPEWVAVTAKRHLQNPVTVSVETGLTAVPEIDHVVYDVEPAEKLDALRTLLDRRGKDPIIVFGRTKHGVKKLARRLEELGYPAAALQGNLSQNARNRVMDAFRAGTVPILLATNVAARGLDVEGVAQVINYEIPESAELFTHRVGRTGRMGRRGEAITFLSTEDAAKWRLIEKALGRSLPRRAWGEPGSAQSKAPETAPRRAVQAHPAAAATPRHARPVQTQPSRVDEPTDGRRRRRRPFWRSAAHRRGPRSSIPSQGGKA